MESFPKVVPRPLVTSYLTQLGCVMPFVTEMTVFVENGVAGVSQMYGWHYRTLYHSMLENVNTLGTRSVQHQRENALALAHSFGNQDLDQLDRSQNAVAFSLTPGAIVVYPATWAVALAMIAGVLLVVTIVIGLRNSQPFERQRPFWCRCLRVVGWALSVGGILRSAYAISWIALMVALIQLCWGLTQISRARKARYGHNAG